MEHGVEMTENAIGSAIDIVLVPAKTIMGLPDDLTKSPDLRITHGEYKATVPALKEAQEYSITVSVIAADALGIVSRYKQTWEKKKKGRQSALPALQREPLVAECPETVTCGETIPEKLTEREQCLQRSEVLQIVTWLQTEGYHGNFSLCNEIHAADRMIIADIFFPDTLCVITIEPRQGETEHERQVRHDAYRQDGIQIMPIYNEQNQVLHIITGKDTYLKERLQNMQGP